MTCVGGSKPRLLSLMIQRGPLGVGALRLVHDSCEKYAMCDFPFASNSEVFLPRI